MPTWTSGAIKRQQALQRRLTRKRLKLERLQRQQDIVQQQIRQQQPIVYYRFVKRTEEAQLIRLVERSALIEGIVRTVVSNVVEGGISIHVQLANGNIVHPDSYLEGPSLATRWTPLVSRMVSDVLTLGYSVVIVQPDEEYPENRIFVPATETVQVRWTTVNRRPMYAAFDAPEADTGTDGGGANGTDGDNNLRSDQPIPNSHVFVMYPPNIRNESTSPVSRCLPLVLQMEKLIANYIYGDSKRTRQPLIIERALTEVTKSGVDIPQVLADLSPGGQLVHRVRNIGSTSREMRRYLDSSAGGGGGGGGGRRRRSAASTRPPEMDAIDQPIAYLQPGESVARNTTVPVIDGRDTTTMLQELIAMVGRTMGVSADYLRGGESGGTKLVAGVEASRKQLAVMINGLQGPIARHLELIFAHYYKDLLRELLASGTETDDTAGRAGVREMRAATTPANADAEGGGEDTGADNGTGGRVIMNAEEAANGSDDASEAGGAGDAANDTASDHPGDGTDRVVVQFNNTPYLDYQNARLLYQDRIITADALRHMAARMFRVPESFLTPRDIKVGPYQVLIQPSLPEFTRDTGEETVADATATGDETKREPRQKRRSASGGGGPSPKRQKPTGVAPSRRAQLGPPPPSAV